MLSGSIITNTDKENSVSVLGNKKLLGQSQFTVKLIKYRRFVALGASDIQNKDRKNVDWNINSIRYFNDCNYSVSGSRVGQFGSGFTEGEEVTVAIDLNLGKI